MEKSLQCQLTLANNLPSMGQINTGCRPRGCSITYPWVWLLPKVHSFQVFVKTQQTSPNWGEKGEGPQNHWLLVFWDVKVMRDKKGLKTCSPSTENGDKARCSTWFWMDPFFCKGHYWESGPNVNGISGWRVYGNTLYCFYSVLWIWQDFKGKKKRNYVVRVPASDHTIAINLSHQMDYYSILFFIGFWY